MPLVLEIKAGKDWRETGRLQPGAQTGSMSNIKPDGTREIIAFDCRPDDAESTIFRSQDGSLDLEVGTVLRVIDQARFDVIQTLKDGESLVLDVRTPRMPAAFPVRFTHRKA